MTIASFDPVLRQVGQNIPDRELAEDSAAGIQEIPSCLISYIEKSGDGYRTVSLFDMDQMNMSEGDQLQSGQSIIYMDKSRMLPDHCFAMPLD